FDSGRRAALEPAAEERSRRPPSGIRCGTGLGRVCGAGARDQTVEPRHHRRRSQAFGPNHCSPVGRRLSGTRGSSQEKAAKVEGRQRMSPLNYGLTPKMKPLAPKRTALVVALDVGTSKIACLIARLKPQPPQEALRRRSHAVEVIGFSHTESFGMKAGNVVDLVDVEGA